ncbi:MAG: phosphate ABC transporter substrate-binding protein [Gammaproteobacteria bacterium]|nr:phosphate ABC transporter substrate-binding protein [Gammaproteobacteria bacterium]
MKKSQNIFFALLVVLFTVVLPVKAEIVVVTNKATKLPGITLTELGRFYLGQSKSFSSGQRVAVADQATGSAIRQQFYKKVLNMSESELSRYWAKRRFTRKFKPPKMILGDAAIKQWVAMTPNSLGYIDSKSLDNSVKLLLIIP